jgi:type IV secretory pathway TrbL component
MIPSTTRTPQGLGPIPQSFLSPTEIAADLKIVIAIAEALYPILFPKDPAVAEERHQQYAEVEHLATMVWNAFSGKYTPSISDLTSVHWGGLTDLFHSIQQAARRASNAVATTAGEVVHKVSEAATPEAPTIPEVDEAPEPAPAKSTPSASNFVETISDNAPLVSRLIRAEAAAARAAATKQDRAWAGGLYPSSGG